MTSAATQLFLPAECLSCHMLLPFSRSQDLLCAGCRHRCRPVRPPWCERCGQPEPHFGPCRICRDWVPALGRVRSAVWLDGAARRAIHALKYGSLPRIASDLAALMVRHLPHPGAGAALVPIPLAPRRFARRGYNQSEVLAGALGTAWRIPVLSEWLTRARETATQTTLTPAARLANVAGAFAPGRRPVLVGPGLSRFDGPLVLVDDVFTTGATLAAAAEALSEAGAAHIAAVTFGRAVIPDFT